MKSPLYNRAQLHNQTKSGVSNDFAFVNAATSTVDCNVATTSQCVELVTGQKLSAKAIRAIGNDHVGGTGTTLAVAVFEHAGMRRGIDYVRFSERDVEHVRQLLRDGWFVVGFVDYGVIIDQHAPVGSLTYRGIHALGMSGWFRTDGQRMVWGYDPTFDGRTRYVPEVGHKVTYPFKRQKIKFSVYRDAMNAYTGGNPAYPTASGYAVKPR